MVDPLGLYNAKRDFARTREPPGKRGRRSGNSFVVQKHEATRLHWDFRLELDGVLKSWAVTKGPSLDPADKRLAVRTEDHPLAYGGFEGTIPEGEYGGGTVMLWDNGTWEPVPGKDPRKTLEEGHLHFVLHGQRMKGEWLLVRMKPRAGEKRENWLLRKVEDEYAGASGELVDHAVTSVSSKRSMAEIAAGGDVWHSNRRGGGRSRAKAASPGTSARRKATAKLPRFRPPQLATLVDHVPAGGGWFHEVKYDGYRCLIAAAGNEARVYTRSGLDWTERFSGIARAFAALDLPGALIDGEIVALDAAGRPSFSQLQGLLDGDSGNALSCFAFDLLELAGKDLTGLGNRARKDELAALLAAAAPPVHVAEDIPDGERLFLALCAKGYEGIISKAADAPYRGRRSKSWLKVKCTLRQEFVIVGWSESERGRGFRSLLLGTRIDGTLHYAGKVGTGFSQDRIASLLARLERLERKSPALDVPREAARRAHWVRPELVAEIAFTETTAPPGQGGVLRHPSFLGLREDKPAAEVEVEQAMPTPDAMPTTAAFGVKISNPDRVIFPDSGVTKGQLADYYAAMAEPILRFAADRPLSLVRCPQGRAKKCFFQKHDAGTFGAAVKHVPVREKKGGTEDYLYVDSAEGLLTCVQMGTIEFHGWGSRVDPLENPDRIVFDLDPDVGLDFDDVRKAALAIREELANLGLATDPMLSGGKGVHVIAALDAGTAWPEVEDWCERFARAMAEARPDQFTANMRKAERTGRIFLDYLRNQRGSTAVMPWTVRAREGAPIAMPITWDELGGVASPNQFRIADLAGARRRAGLPALRSWCGTPQRLPQT